jgi:hypothetical protein
MEGGPSRGKYPYQCTKPMFTGDFGGPTRTATRTIFGKVYHTEIPKTEAMECQLGCSFMSGALD